ncbi:MAG: hypothetical protein AAF289_19030, partial [Cyanobacteria bacterium P01_A01_bin.135]
VEETGNGAGGDIEITTGVLEVRGGAQLAASTLGQGNAGSVIISATDRVAFAGTSADGQFSSAASSQVEETGNGAGGDIEITTGVLEVRGGAQLAASTLGQGNAGSVIISAADRVTFAGTSADGQFVSGSFSTIEETGVGAGGDIEITTGVLEVRGGARLTASTLGQGNAGDVIITARDSAELVTGFVLSAVDDTAIGIRGDVTVRAGDLTLSNDSLISTQDDRPSSESNTAAGSDIGRLRIIVEDLLVLEDSDITTEANAFAGGDITIRAGDIQLVGDSDIQTFVQGGSQGGGDITLTADSIIAFDDSDILAFAADGQGGDITLNTPAFFGENFDPASLDAAPLTLDDNDRVDINATGAVAGVVTTPDVSFIQNSLADLPENILIPDDLIANSCIARNEDGSSSFVITGGGGLPEQPGTTTTQYPTGDVQPLPNADWQPGDPITEPQGLYQLPNGELVLSHSCQ